MFIANTIKHGIMTDIRNVIDLACGLHPDKIDVGTDYLVGPTWSPTGETADDFVPQKTQFEQQLQARLNPAALTVHSMGMLLLHASTNPKNLHLDIRDGRMYPKTRTMFEPKPGQERDVNPHSSRIIGPTARLMRKYGLDELAQVIYGTVDYLGPRRMQREDREYFVSLARQHDDPVPQHMIDMWMDYFDHPLSRDGLLYKSQAKRRLPQYRYGTTAGAAMTIRDDYEWITEASLLREPEFAADSIHAVLGGTGEQVTPRAKQAAKLILGAQLMPAVATT